MRRDGSAVRYRLALRCVLAALAALLAASARADGARAANAATWDLGIGVAALHFPDYPGASRSRDLILPFPYIVYRSPHLEVNNTRVRGIVLAGSRFSLDVDVAGAVAVNSSRDPERRGMPNLDWLGEAGPALRYDAWNDAHASLDLVLALRAAASARGLRLHRRGWAWAPRLEYKRRSGSATHGNEFDASLEARWADAGLNDYVYGVAPQYADAERPAFSPGAGYAGYSASVGMSLRRGARVVGWLLRFTSLGGSVVAASPLVSRRQSVTIGVDVAWILNSHH